MAVYRLPRYPNVGQGRRCDACGGIINVDRRGSKFDVICNRLINPLGPGKGGSRDLGEILRTPRPNPPGWEDRLEMVRAMHADMRQDKPGWGRISVAVLEADIAQRVAVWQLNRDASGLMDALRGSLGA